MRSEPHHSEAATFDPILLELLWTRMMAIAEEVGATIARTGFSTVLRENRDYSVGIFDTNGVMLAQSSQSATGHIGAMPYLAQELLSRIALETWGPGDVVITNDPWIGCGHSNDLYVAAPIEHRGTIVGMVVNSAHQMDIGGRIASPFAEEVFEEGLLLPPVFLYRDGELQTSIADIVRRNVRFAERVFGDIQAQVSALFLGARRVSEAMSEYNLAVLQPLAGGIVKQTERQMRTALRSLTPGIYRSELGLEEADGRGGELQLKMQMVVDNEGSVDVDFTGSSEQVRRPINCVLNYTRAYTVLGLKFAVAPWLPNNAGSYAPIRILAPSGTILNANFPAACHWRHIVGLRIPDMIFAALADATPETVLAGSGACPVWLFTISGQRSDGSPFLLNAHAMGGLGARFARDGVSAVTFPPNVRDIPVEIIENETPLLIGRRELRSGSGGDGRTRGGLGEILEFIAPLNGGLDEYVPTLLQVFPGRLRRPASGLQGGDAGMCGAIELNGRTLHAQEGHEIRMVPGDIVRYLTPGGGGYGPGSERDPERRANDLAEAYVIAVDPADSGNQGQRGGLESG